MVRGTGGGRRVRVRVRVRVGVRVVGSQHRYNNLKQALLALRVVALEEEPARG